MGCDCGKPPEKAECDESEELEAPDQVHKVGEEQPVNYKNKKLLTAKGQHSTSWENHWGLPTQPYSMVCLAPNEWWVFKYLETGTSLVSAKGALVAVVSFYRALATLFKFCGWKWIEVDQSG